MTNRHRHSLRQVDQACKWANGTPSCRGALAGVVAQWFPSFSYADVDRRRGLRLDTLPTPRAGEKWLTVRLGLGAATVAGTPRPRVLPLRNRFLVETGFLVAKLHHDAVLLAASPPSVDLCGERGEFHTLCYGGPIFAETLAVRAGERCARGGCRFADVVPCE